MRYEIEAPKPLGKEFEDTISAAFYEYFRRRGAEKDCKQVTGTLSDYYGGTDLEIMGVPVDVTYYFKGKDHTVILPSEVETPVSTIKYGVRTGNGHVKFQQPVLVIGVDEEDSFIRMFLERLAECVKHMARKILETGFDAYWDYLDSVEA